MKPLFVLFWQLCRFQKGPQDVPFSPPLLVLLFGVVLLLSASILYWLEPQYFLQQLLGSLVALIAWGAMVWAVLNFKKANARFVQTMTACFGTDVVISLASVPLQLFIFTAATEGGIGVLTRLALLTLLIWDILIKARIYSVSMELGRLQGNLLSITIWVSVLLISNSFLPPEALESIQPDSTAQEQTQNSPL